MAQKSFATWTFLLASVVMAGACGGSGAESSPAADAAESDGDSAATPDAAGESGGDAAETDSAVGFGELMEGSFIFTGAVDERFYVSDAEYAFRLGGGCADGQFGFSVNIADPAGEKSFAQLGAQVAQDLSDGRTGEFDAVDVDVAFFPGGDFSLTKSFDGQIRMIVSEHDTGGVDAILDQRRLTITLLGILTGDDGEVDVDVTFRWVMGCP
jgi:hypothetical protein